MRLSGFGSPLPPVRRWERSMQTRSPASAYRNVGGSNPLRTVQQLQHREAQSLFRPTFAVEPAGYGMMPVANQGNVSPAAGLSGLGVYNTVGCDSFEQALKDLEEVVTRGEGAGISSLNLQRAATVLKEETGWNPLNRTAVYPTNCKAQTARIAAIVNAAMADLPAAMRFGVSASVSQAQAAANLDASNAGKPPEDLSFTAKFAIIGGVTVAGLIAAAVITGQVAPLLRTVKKVVS